MRRIGVENTAGVVKRYLTNLLSTSHPTTVDKVLESVEIVVIEDMNRGLTMPFVGEKYVQPYFKCTPQSLLDHMVCLLIFSKVLAHSRWGCH